MTLLDMFHEHRPFPGQDPWVVPHEGSLLLLQSGGDSHRIVAKRFSDLQHINRNVEKVIWAPDSRSGHSRQIWAPELHRIDGRWYVYFSASEGQGTSHRSYVLVADDPLGPYTEIGPVSDPNADFWAIDLTVFPFEGRLYALWSGWDGPGDGFPQNLYIAPMRNPWTISGGRRCISRPEHGWEMTVAPVNEGPEVIRNPVSGRPFVLYAADASWTQSYKMGLLEWAGGDVTDPASWKKVPRPFFTGGGHGCVVDTADGTFLVYHRKLSGDPGWADREIRWAPLTWGADGYPVVHTATPAPITAAAVDTSPPVGLAPRIAS